MFFVYVITQVLLDGISSNLVRRSRGLDVAGGGGGGQSPSRTRSFLFTR